MIYIKAFLWLCKIFFMVMIILNITIFPFIDMTDTRLFFKRHRWLSCLVMVITIIGFLGFILDIITGKVI